eukprot:TRINITY_DN96991_c0_g1_i1.p1 TRINITY_DN96991_c0_g1~~TRINITY_DN96991_c0_g1_i1.p1  ORF type:complete len:184 (+),score=17.59 TRINITY_DN96991_c0_g1_i1:332-883(+)
MFQNWDEHNNSVSAKELKERWKNIIFRKFLSHEQAAYPFTQLFRTEFEDNWVFHYTNASQAIVSSGELRPSTHGLFGPGVYFMCAGPWHTREHLQEIAYDSTGQQFEGDIGCILIEKAALCGWLENNHLQLYGPLQSGRGEHWKITWVQPPWNRELPTVDLTSVGYAFYHSLDDELTFVPKTD